MIDYLREEVRSLKELEFLDQIILIGETCG